MLKIRKKELKLAATGAVPMAVKEVADANALLAVPIVAQEIVVEHVKVLAKVLVKDRAAVGALEVVYILAPIKFNPLLRQ